MHCTCMLGIDHQWFSGIRCGGTGKGHKEYLRDMGRALDPDGEGFLGIHNYQSSSNCIL